MTIIEWQRRLLELHTQDNPAAWWAMLYLAFRGPA